MTDIIIRNETPDDYRKVENITREAFWNVYEPGCLEHYLLNKMRLSPDFIPELDIVAEFEGQIVGNAACAKSHIEGDDNRRHPTITLGPISVLPAFQHKGIGRRMIGHITDAAGRMGYEAIVLCGDPLLYSGYGFVAAERYGIRTSDNKFFPALHVYPLNGTDLTTCSGRYIESSIYETDPEQAESFDRYFPAKEKIADTPTQLRFREIMDMVGEDL